MSDYDLNKYYLSQGTLQACICRKSPHFMYFFGLAQYQRELPIITESMRIRVQPILDGLNSGELTESQAKEMLDKIW